MKKLTGAAIIAAAGAAGLIAAGRYLFHTESNTEHMYDSIDYGMSIIGSEYSIKKLDAGKFADMSMKGLMSFHVDRYRIEGLGNLAVMSTKKKMMQMSSIVITPCGVNVPLASFDLMYIMGKRKYIIEFYDLVKDKGTDEYRGVLAGLEAMRDSFSDIPDIPPKGDEKEWFGTYSTVIMHKQFTMKDDARGIVMFMHALRTYLEAAKRVGAASDEDKAAQQKNTSDYVDRLIADSGVSTAYFKKVFGEEFTRDFFTNVFFACESCE